MLKRTIFTMLIMLFSVVLVSADGVDDEGNPNDPNDNKRANACFDGGTLEGKCDTPWEWRAGWFLIRFEYGLINRQQFPTAFASILPPVEEPSVSAPSTPSTPSANCVQYTTVPQSVNFAGGYILLAGDTWYHNSADCTTGANVIGANLAAVYAPAPLDPLALCNLNGTFSSYLSIGYINDVYWCQV